VSPGEEGDQMMLGVSLKSLCWKEFGFTWSVYHEGGIAICTNSRFMARLVWRYSISKKAQSLKWIVMDEQLLQAIVKYLKAI
jgi:hypothetical protein